MRSGHIQHMQKALELMNLKLSQVISDITGQTGLDIIRAIVDGEHDPVNLAQYRNPRCRSNLDDIAKALASYDFYTQQIKDCDAEVEAKYQAFKPVLDLDENPLPPPTKKSRRQATHPDYDLRTYLYQMTGVDLTEIDGLEALSVQTILSEIGLDMSKWKTVKHFTSWLGLAPHNNISGGKVLSCKTKKTKNRANTALRLAAQSAGRSDSALGGFYRRMRAKHGTPKAITATAHKIARIIYSMLKHRTPYQDLGQDYYEHKYRERVIKNLQRKAHGLGLQLVSLTPKPFVSWKDFTPLTTTPLGLQSTPSPAPKSLTSLIHSRTLRSWVEKFTPTKYISLSCI